MPARIMMMTLLGLASMAGGAARARTSISDPSVVLRAARRALGDDADVAAVQTIETVAACTGPRVRYETHVVSARDGRAIFEQRFPDGRAERAVVSDTAPRDPIERLMIQGHEIHMLVVAPETRLGPPVTAGDTVFAGRPAVVLTFRDQLGAPVFAYFARSDSLPLGFLMPNHRTDGKPSITLTIDSWRTVGRLRLPARATYHQGADRYEFQFTTVRLNAPFPNAPAPRPR